MTSVKIFQIFYDEGTRRGLDPGFTPLDNSDNVRPDWFEYWPIRNWLLANPFEEDAFYGFFSPRFGEKTGLSAPDVGTFIETSAQQGCDVAIFTPPHDFDSFFLNVFEQAEFHHPGFVGISQEFCDAIGLKVAVSELVMDARNTVYSNYFVARPRFWRSWFAITEKLFARAEDTQNPLAAALTRSREHRPGASPVQFKVFLMERVVSLLLATTREFRTATYPSRKVFPTFPVEAIACEALRLAWAERGDPAYRAAFRHLRDKVLTALAAAGRE